MSNRLQIPIEIGQMGKVWVASFSLLGISVVGATQADAVEAAFEALKTHFLAGVVEQDFAPCEACS